MSRARQARILSGPELRAYARTHAKRGRERDVRPEELDAVLTKALPPSRAKRVKQPAAERDVVVPQGAAEGVGRAIEQAHGERVELGEFAHSRPIGITDVPSVLSLLELALVQQHAVEGCARCDGVVWAPVQRAQRVRGTPDPDELVAQVDVRMRGEQLNVLVGAVDKVDQRTRRRNEEEVAADVGRRDIFGAGLEDEEVVDVGQP